MVNRAFRSLSLVAFIVGVSGMARAAEVQKVTFQGSGVSVSYFGNAAITCADGSLGFVSAFGILLGAEQISASTGMPPFMSNGVFVQVDSYSNSCTGVMMSNANSGLASGFTPPDKKLTSSALVGTASVQDFATGAQVSVSIDIDLFGEGQLQVSKLRSRSSQRGVPGGPVTVTTTRSANTNRNGTAEGTMSIDGVDIAPEFFSVSLFGSSNATRTVSR